MSQPMESKVRRSILALQGRQAVLLLIQLGIGIHLARLLGPETFGIYGIATFCLSLITLIADFGLAGSLVQRKADFGEHEISVAFTLQTGISLVAAVAVWFLAPFSLQVYRQAPHELVWIIRSLTLQIVLSAVATTAKLQLEREIQFHKVATIDIVAMIGGNAVLLAMVHLGYGIWSFVGGTVTTALLTATVAWAMIQHRPKLRWDTKLVREFLSFGLPFQFTNITNDAAGWIIPLVSGAWLGPVAVGLLTWSSSNGRRPLMVVENVMRVAFPHFSRLQENPAELGRQVSLYFRRLLMLCWAWTFLAVLLGTPMTILVYTEKWEPGVLALQLFAAGLVADVVNWVGGMTLNAIGGVRETAKWTTVKSVMSIGGAVVLVKLFGLAGIPLASLLASAVSSAGILWHLRHKIPIDHSQIWKPAVPFALAGAAYAPFALAGGAWQTPARWVFGFGAMLWTTFGLVSEFGLLSRLRARGSQP